jgi:hypothetical protein
MANKGYGWVPNNTTAVKPVSVPLSWTSKQQRNNKGHGPEIVSGRKEGRVHGTVSFRNAGPRE